MYLKNLINAVAGIEQMPIEVSELANSLIAAGCQDSIIFHPVDEDPSVFQGLYYQYTTHPGVYSAPELVTLVVYTKNVPLSMQRTICCKELIHACDSKVERTKTEEEVNALLEKVLGPLSTEKLGLADVMATKDKLAIYQAFALLFPPFAREQALRVVEAKGNSTEVIELIARWACLPEPFIEFALSPEWPEIRQSILDGWGE